MADLQAWAAAAQILGALTVVGGVWFAAVQIREFRRQRHEVAAIELVRSILTPDFSHSFRRIWELPDGITADDVRSRGPEVENAVIGIFVPMESFAVLVYKGVLELEILDHLVGGFVRDAWRKLRPFIESERARLGTKNLAEWFQWLAERLEEHPVPGKAAGAYASYRTWRPAAG